MSGNPNITNHVPFLAVKSKNADSQAMQLFQVLTETLPSCGAYIDVTEELDIIDNIAAIELQNYLRKTYLSKGYQLLLTYLDPSEGAFYGTLALKFDLSSFDSKVQSNHINQYYIRPFIPKNYSHTYTVIDILKNAQKQREQFIQSYQAKRLHELKDQGHWTVHIKENDFSNLWARRGVLVGIAVASILIGFSFIIPFGSILTVALLAALTCITGGGIFGKLAGNIAVSFEDSRQIKRLTEQSRQSQIRKEISDIPNFVEVNASPISHDAPEVEDSSPITSESEEEAEDQHSPHTVSSLDSGSTLPLASSRRTKSTVSEQVLIFGSPVVSRKPPPSSDVSATRHLFF